MKYLKIFFILLLASFGVVFAQGTDSQDSIMIEKLRFANELIMENEYEDAFQLYLECSSEGNALAMNAIGILKQRGWGTELDETGSIQWFEQAALAGYAKAYYNLFLIYAKALGVEQNFENAINYLDSLRNTEHFPIALMLLGYYHYKGFGVEQNYETAVDFFLQSAEFYNPDAFYFLGLCYRNGYGVIANESEAQYYLIRAANLGHYFSIEELDEESTEIIIEPKHIEMNGENQNGNTENLKIPSVYKYVEKQSLNLNEDILGEYVGVIVMYDYSGKSIIRKSNLKILFEETQDDKIIGKWVENDTLFTDFEAVLEENSLKFIDTEYIHTDRYSRHYAKKWKFNNAILEKTETDSISYLTGNIRQYDVKQKEPGKPLYVSLQKNKFSQSTIQTEEFFITYPNPFDGEINILFYLENEQNVKFSVYGINGKLYDSQNLGLLKAGTHNYLLALAAPKGQYMLVLQTDKKKKSNLITKK